MGRIGGPFSFVDFQLIRRNWFRSAFRVGGGLGFVEKPYDPQDNHKNLLLGSSANVYLNFLWKNEIRLGPQWYINGGLSFSHLSNGKVSLPNLGLNVPAFTAGIRFAPDRATLVEQPVSDSFSKKINMQLLVSAGIKQEPTVGGKRYLVNVFSGEATRQFSGSGRYGAGVLVSIDRSWGDHSVDSIIPRRASVEKPFNASVFVSYEQLLGKFSIPVQLGVYVIEKYYGEALYQNFGLRYHMNRNWSTGIYLKTHFGHADYIHAGIGYRF